MSTVYVHWTRVIGRDIADSCRIINNDAFDRTTKRCYICKSSKGAEVYLGLCLEELKEKYGPEARMAVLAHGPLTIPYVGNDWRLKEGGDTFHVFAGSRVP